MRAARAFVLCLSCVNSIPIPRARTRVPGVPTNFPPHPPKTKRKESSLGLRQQRLLLKVAVVLHTFSRLMVLAWPLFFVIVCTLLRGVHSPNIYRA